MNDEGVEAARAGNALHDIAEDSLSGPSEADMIADQVIKDVSHALNLLSGPLDYDHINDAIQTLERARGRLN